MFSKLLKDIIFFHYQNQSREKRTVRMVMTTSSMFYTGNKAHLVKRGDGDFVMQPNESKFNFIK